MTFRLYIRVALLSLLLSGVIHADEDRTRDIGRIDVAFSAAAKAARDLDSQAALIVLSPDLCSEMQDGRYVKIQETGDTIHRVFKVWTDELQRVRASKLDQPHTVRMLKHHKVDGVWLIEACVEFHSDALTWIDLWYFTDNGDSLQFADWPFGGDPERTVKHFKLSRE